MSARGGWPVELVAANDVALGAVVWRVSGSTLPLHVTVVASACLAYAADGTVAVADPAPLTRERGLAPVRMVTASSDLAPFLPEADVWFSGDAHAVHTDVRSMTARFAVGDEQAVIDKAVHVVGDRWSDRGQESAPLLFRRMPIEHERALACADNPFGSAGLPNILDPADPGRPAGFGLIPPNWPSRRAWTQGPEPPGLAAPIAVVPAGFDFRFFQAAPADQRCPYLCGDEWLMLEGLDVDAARVRVQLPGVRASVRVRSTWRGRTERDVMLWLDGLHIDGASRRLRLRWRGCFPIESVAELAKMVVLGELGAGGVPRARVGGQTEGMSTAEREKLRADIDDVLREAATTQPLDEAPLATTVEAAPVLAGEQVAQDAAREARATLRMSESDELGELRRELGIGAAGPLRPAESPEAPWAGATLDLPPRRYDTTVPLEPEGAVPPARGSSRGQG